MFLFIIVYISERVYISNAGEWQYSQSPDIGTAIRIATPNQKINPLVEKKINIYSGYKVPINNSQIMDSLSQEVRITYSGTVRDVKAMYSKRVGKVVYVWSEEDNSCPGTGQQRLKLHVWKEDAPYMFVFNWCGTSDPDIAIGDTNRWALISFNDAADDSLYWIYYDLIADSLSYYYWAYEPANFYYSNTQTCEWWESFTVFQEPLPNGNYATFFTEVVRWWQSTNSSCPYSPGQNIDSSGSYIGSFLFRGSPPLGVISGSYKNVLGFMYFYANPTSDKGRRISINFGRDYLYHPIAKNNNNLYFMAYEVEIWRPPVNIVNKWQWIDFVVLNSSRDTINTGTVANRLTPFGVSNYIAANFPEDTFPSKHPDIASNGSSFTVGFTRIWINSNNFDNSTGDYDIGRRYVAFSTPTCSNNRWCIYGGDYAARSGRREYHPRIEFDLQNYILAYGDSMFSLPSSKLRWREVCGGNCYSDTAGRVVTNNLFRYAWNTITSSFDLVPTYDTVRCVDNSWRRVMRFVYIKTLSGTDRDIYYRKMVYTGCITPVSSNEKQQRDFYYNAKSKFLSVNVDEVKLYDLSGRIVGTYRRGNHKLDKLNKGVYFINGKYEILVF